MGMNSAVLTESEGRREGEERARTRTLKLFSTSLLSESVNDKRALESSSVWITSKEGRGCSLALCCHFGNVVLELRRAAVWIKNVRPWQPFVTGKKYKWDTLPPHHDYD